MGWAAGRRQAKRLGIFVLVTLSAMPVASQVPTDTVGFHLVRPGETLQSITRHYLGTISLWRDNWKLNPELKEPHLLRSGQRLRVILRREIPARSALIEEVSNEVDKNLQETGWEDAIGGDQLKPRDGVRTLSKSSATLTFDDTSTLSLSEHSQIFLRKMSTNLDGVKKGSIEIEKGQADLVLRAPRPDRSLIEIMVGASVTRPRVGATGEAELRSRQADGGASQHMVYRGATRVEAGGAAVEVPGGMGTAVPDGGVPSPPERLLPRPAPSVPARGSSWDFSNPPFRWTAVPGAVSYTLEVCRDASCRQLVERAVGIEQAAWTTEAPLPLGEHYWRATAVSASGLDGYPSRALPFGITSERLDLEPPVVVAARLGAGTVSARGFVLGDGGKIRLVAHDDASGPELVRYRWNGGPWQTWTGADLALPEGGSHRLDFSSTDVLGRASEVWSIEVSRAMAVPSPPRVSRDG